MAGSVTVPIKPCSGELTGIYFPAEESSVDFRMNSEYLR